MCRSFWGASQAKTILVEQIFAFLQLELAHQVVCFLEVYALDIVSCTIDCRGIVKSQRFPITAPRTKSVPQKSSNFVKTSRLYNGFCRRHFMVKS